jgi:hypothetical protein
VLGIGDVPIPYVILIVDSDLETQAGGIGTSDSGVCDPVPRIVDKLDGGGNIVW